MISRETLKEKIYSPYIRINDNTSLVMLDVIIALLPLILIAYFAFGVAPVMVIIMSVAGSVLAEFIFSLVFFKEFGSVKDFSAIVTGILLGMTLAPFTPIYIAAFGGAAAVIFGKLMFGGLGRNIFNPALIGREFMTIFFPAAMSSEFLWYNPEFIRKNGIDIFAFLGQSDLLTYLKSLFFNPAGAIGEYSVFLLILGGLYLLWRDRISWHIPVSIFVMIFLCLTVTGFLDIKISLSLGGLMLGGIYMATDMPTSSTTPIAKIFYGTMIGLAIILCWLTNITFETLSFSILIMNAFKGPIDDLCRPRVFGEELEFKKRLYKGILLFFGIILAIIAVMFCHHHNLLKYLVFMYIFYASFRFIRSKDIK